MSAVKLWNDKKGPYKYYKSCINVVQFPWQCEKDTEMYVLLKTCVLESSLSEVEVTEFVFIS